MTCANTQVNTAYLQREKICIQQLVHMRCPRGSLDMGHAVKDFRPTSTSMGKERKEDTLTESKHRASNAVPANSRSQGGT